PPLNANVDYKNKTWSGYSSIFVTSAQILKSSIQIAVNPVTKEQVTVANDWTMNFVSVRLYRITSTIPYPTFAGFLDVTSGKLVASSDPSIDLLTSDGRDILNLVNVKNNFAQDLASYFVSSFQSNTTMAQVLDFVQNMDQSGTNKIYVNRYINGVNWLLELRVMPLLGQRFIFAVFINIDFVQADIKASGEKTGYMMLGIILAFLILGSLFSWTIAYQLGLVAKQIDLLKQLKFTEVLDKETGIKGRSFIFELADLQQAFFEMATAFAKSLKSSYSVRATGTHPKSDHNKSDTVA
ncbi:hypothetical protein HDU99_009951, partial [Rhizoclosmatium hyalinum]